MSADIPLPAALPRRLIAALYDALLLLALWMITALADAIVRRISALPPNINALRLCLFLVGLAFFGWFWTHGGQTLGMRAWRLQVRRDDGAPLRWPVAAVRYAAAYLSWALAGIGILWSLVDARRRCLHDIVSGTEVVLLPKAASTHAGEPGQ
ncbi:MAG TPA: RDD family protein, partial [Nevskiaceae bacterium]|nr:RDD family protein [Nevskiaceae bacterium]